MSPHS
jgi:hypothetical protein